MDNLLNYFLAPDPLSSFKEWFEAASKTEQNAPAMSVATYDAERNRPVIRMLLFKGFQNDSLIFYTNYLSHKSRDLDLNPEVCLNFFWQVLGRQVRVQGKVEKMSHRDSEDYFHSRDRDSQLASYISTQSSAIEDKDALIRKFENAKREFEGKTIPCPEHWGGYLVKPYEFEFFLYGANRLNDRFLFELKNNDWEVSRLQP